MSRAAINNQEDRPLCPNQKPFQKLDEYIGINAAFFLDHKPHVALRGNRREQAHAMPSAGCYHNGRFAFLAPSAPGMMIRADMRRIAKIDVRTQCFRGFLDLRKFRLQPFLDQRRIAFQRLV
jgi:hypothetical protein